MADRILPFRVKLSEKYLKYAQVPASKKFREGTVMRENKGGSRYVVLWDGCKTGKYIAKSFVQAL